MTYVYSGALQQAIFTYLHTDTEVIATIGDNIFDANYDDLSEVADTFVSLGEEKVMPFNSMTDSGAKHEIIISIISSLPGFSKAKEWAALISKKMLSASPAIEGADIVSINFSSALAKRINSPALRRIDLKFIVTLVIN